MLAYLTLAVPHGPVGRERLISVFWSGGSAERGRGSVRNAVHFLRKHLGPAAVRSRGDSLAVDRELVRCDARLFDEQLAAARPGEALDLYGGEFLPGLGSVGARAFAEWLEAERADYRRKAAGAAWELAEAAEQRLRWISAVDHARRAVALSADPEQAVRRLMRLLERAGDGVAAIREYESFEARWSREHRVEPSVQTRALARAIRERSHDALAEQAAAVRSTDKGGRQSTGVSIPLLPPHARESPGKIAVLPFLRTGPEPEHGHLAAGVTHGLIGSLSRLSSILVVARTSVERYAQGGDPRALGSIAEELGVDTVLQGSLGLSEDRLAIAVQLVDARTATPIWAEIYERPVSELLSVQTQLVQAILDVLGVDLSATEEARIAGPPTSDPEAYELYLKGRFRMNRRSKPDMQASVDYFERALARDPGFALVHAALAETLLLHWPMVGVRQAEARVRAREAAQAALRADHRLGEAHATLAMLRAHMDHDWYGAEADFRRAIELSPGHATAHHWWGAYVTFVLGRFEEGAAELELARELDPLSPIINTDIGLALLHQGRPRESIRKLQSVAARYPDLWRAQHDLGVALAMSGDPEGGVEHLRRAWSLGAWGVDPGPILDAGMGEWRETLEHQLAQIEGTPTRGGMRGFRGASIAALLDRPDQVMEWLRTSQRDESFNMVVQYFPLFEPLMARPDFVTMLEGAGLRADLGRTG